MDEESQSGVAEAGWGDLAAEGVRTTVEHQAVEWVEEKAPACCLVDRPSRALRPYCLAPRHTDWPRLASSPLSERLPLPARADVV